MSCESEQCTLTRVHTVKGAVSSVQMIINSTHSSFVCGLQKDKCHVTIGSKVGLSLKGLLRSKGQKYVWIFLLIIKTSWRPFWASYCRIKFNNTLKCLQNPIGQWWILSGRALKCTTKLTKVCWAYRNNRKDMRCSDCKVYCLITRNNLSCSTRKLLKQNPPLNSQSLIKTNKRIPTMEYFRFVPPTIIASLVVVNAMPSKSIFSFLNQTVVYQIILS